MTSIDISAIFAVVLTGAMRCVIIGLVINADNHRHPRNLLILILLTEGL